MDYRLVLVRPLRYRDRKRGMQEVAAGEYLVPDQIAREIAQMAIDQGVGRREEIRMPATAATQEPCSYCGATTALHDPTCQAPPDRLQQKPRGRGRRKGRAPENKIVNASENKTTLV